MSIEPRERHVPIAHLIRIRPDLIEVRYANGCLLNTKGLEEVRQARQELMGTTPYGMLSFIPEDADFDLAAMHRDHLASDRNEGDLKAIALVTAANMMEMMLKLYFSYYPQLARILVTDKEAEARAWLMGQLEEVAKIGS